MGIGSLLGGGLIGLAGSALGKSIKGGNSSGGVSKLIGGPIIEIPNPLQDIIVEVIKEVLFEPRSQPINQPLITEDEKKRLLEIIDQGRQNGCSELRIHIRREHAHLFAANGKIFVDLPLDVSATVEDKGEAGIYLVVSYFEQDPAGRIGQLHDLLQKGAITKKEYEKAKANLLKRM